VPRFWILLLFVCVCVWYWSFNSGPHACKEGDLTTWVTLLAQSLNTLRRFFYFCMFGICHCRIKNFLRCHIVFFDVSVTIVTHTLRLMFLFLFGLFLFLNMVNQDLKLELMHLKSTHAAHWTMPPDHFVLVILEMGSPELIVWVVLELWSSRSQPPK
jgi:hypothetical protein